MSEARRASVSAAKQYSTARLCAFHEAGHAVFSTLKGTGVEVVTIDPQRVKELTGQERPGYTLNKESRLVEADIALCSAAVGLTSEAMFVSGGVVNPKEDDITRINEMLDQLGLTGLARQNKFDSTRLMAQQFISDNRSPVEAIAEALMEQKTLTGDDVRRIIEATGAVIPATT